MMAAGWRGPGPRAVLGTIVWIAVAFPHAASSQIPDSIEMPAVHSLTARPGAPPWVTPGVPDTIWLLVESATEVGGEEEKARLRYAERLARVTLEGQEDDVGRRYALAVVLGLRADREGGRTKVRAASALYEELEVLLEIAPNHAQARHLMGRLHAGVRRMNRVTRWLATNLLGGDVLKGATWELAEEHLAFAEREAPEVAEHHLQLANLFRDTGRPEQALDEARHVLALEATTPLAIKARAEAEDLVRSLLR